MFCVYLLHFHTGEECGQVAQTQKQLLLLPGGQSSSTCCRTVCTKPRSLRRSPGGAHHDNGASQPQTRKPSSCSRSPPQPSQRSTETPHRTHHWRRCWGIRCHLWESGLSRGVTRTRMEQHHNPFPLPKATLQAEIFAWYSLSSTQAVAQFHKWSYPPWLESWPQMDMLMRIANQWPQTDLLSAAKVVESTTIDKFLCALPQRWERLWACAPKITPRCDNCFGKSPGHFGNGEGRKREFFTIPRAQLCRHLNPQLSEPQRPMAQPGPQSSPWNELMSMEPEATTASSKPSPRIFHSETGALAVPLLVAKWSAQSPGDSPIQNWHSDATSTDPSYL